MITFQVAEFEATSAESLSSTSNEVTGSTHSHTEEEDCFNTPINQLTKSQYSKFMEEVKALVTFNPHGIRPL